MDAAIASGDGCKWLEAPTGGQYRKGYWPGFAHGAAGIGYALLEVWRMTAEKRYKTVALKAGAWLKDVSVPASPCGRGLSWPDLEGDEEARPPTWCHGAAGIGLFFARAFQLTGDANYLELARRCAVAVEGAGDAFRNPTRCHGVAGNIELFLALGQALGQQAYVRKAQRLGDLLENYRWQCGGQVIWCSEYPGKCTPDYMGGTAGIGHCFVELASPQTTSVPIMGRPTVAPPDLST